MSLAWNERLMGTGVDEIDAQHKELFNQLNQLFDALETGLPETEVKSILGFLGQYAVEHFSFEEDCFERHHCPAAQANKNAHSQFLEVFQGISDRVAHEGVSAALAIETQQQISDWIRNHIMRIDTKLRPCVTAATNG